MSEEQISTSARLNAERLMSGRKITDDEMRVIIAGLMLSVDKLANSFNDLKDRLWSDEQVRKMIVEEIAKNCREKNEDCPAETGKSATWVGRMLRSLFRGGAAAVVMLISGCAVVATRSAGLASDMVYPAVRLDAAGWVLTCWPGGGHGQWGGDYSKPEQWFFTPLMTAGCLVDLVPSMAVDTVLLPVDLAFGD